MDPSSPEAAGVATGHLLFYLIVLGIGVFFSIRLARKKGRKFVVWPTVVAVVLVALSMFGQSQR